MHWEVPVSPYPCFTLTRLLLETKACLRAAQSALGYGHTARTAIWLLDGVDVTDRGIAAALLCNMDHSLRELEDELRLSNRPFSAKKVRNVWEQVRVARQLAIMH
jgi:hypothetical protein